MALFTPFGPGLADSQSSGQPGAMTIKVLICDDTADLRILYRAMLSTEPNIDVVGEARNGAEAVTMTEALRPDVVLLDVVMPEKNGLEALEEINRDYPETKVIVLTGLEQGRTSQLAEELGAADYMVKGTDFGDIAERIRQVAG